ncbi:LysR family transcriptional regulator [Serratia sp. S1B]|nr:LysR family transcriptional regulator [Serratia sp. S1B]
MLDDLLLFVQIVDAGSLNKAAHQLKLPPSTLTRHLQKLEARLGCRLLHRSARNLVLTPEGWLYYEQCRPLIQSLQQTTERLDETINQVSGIVRVLAPVNLANGILAPAWSSFIQQYPDVRLALKLSNDVEDIFGLKADLAIRVGELPDSQLNMRRLGTIGKMLLVASPAYLAAKPAIEKPADLLAHDLLVSDPLLIWNLHHHASGESFRLVPQARFSVNEFSLSLQMAGAGAGILFSPLTLCYDYLQQGRLVQVLPEWTSKPRQISMVWPQQRHIPARMRVLIEHLADYAAKEPLLNGMIEI